MLAWLTNQPTADQTDEVEPSKIQVTHQLFYDYRPHAVPCPAVAPESLHKKPRGPLRAWAGVTSTRAMLLDDRQ